MNKNQVNYHIYYYIYKKIFPIIIMHRHIGPNSCNILKTIESLFENKKKLLLVRIVKKCSIT